jgi:hypothetical protein
MKKAQEIFLASLLLFFASPSCCPQTALQQAQVGSLQIRVREYNYARVPADELHAAEGIAGQVLREARIEAEWDDCPLPAGKPRADSPTCAAPLRATDLLLYLVDRLEAHFPYVASTALGYSIIPDGHGLASMTYVSYSRILKLFASTSAEAKDLLGLAVAHEIGHLLFGTLDHANQGIMRASWPLRVLETRAWDDLQFTKEQGKRLRRAVEERDRASVSTLAAN